MRLIDILRSGSIANERVSRYFGTLKFLYKGGASYMMTQGEMEFKINNLYEIVQTQQEEIRILNNIIKSMANEKTKLLIKSFHRTPGKDKE